MKKFIQKCVATLAVAALILVPSTSVFAVDAFEGVCDPSSGNNDSVLCENKNDSAGDVLKTVINTLLFITGALAVIMLIYGGLRYTASGGNATSITAAKNTIMYAIIGLVVAFLAFAIVNWVEGIF